MDIRLLITSLIPLLLVLHTNNASALTMNQFSEICHSSPDECSEHPIIRAYIGGALDLLATLDERTDYLEKVYCSDTKALFDMRSIIDFMENHSEQYRTDNAMLVLVKYFEKHGGCNHE